MKIKKAPDSKQMPLHRVEKGKCFMLLDWIEDYLDEDGYERDWRDGEIFMVCGSDEENKMVVVNLEEGTICKFNANIVVEKVEACVTFE